MKLSNTQFDQIAVCNVVKDKNFRFVSCSENFVELGGEDSPSSMCGKDDFQAIWAKQAPDIRADDIRIIKGELKYINVPEIIDVMESGQVKQRKVLVTKIPIFNKRGLCIGLSCSLVNVPFPENENIGDRISDRMDEKGRLLLPKKLGSEYITAREFQVLKGVLLGRTAEEISKELYISRRTVESHTESLKGKLQCSSKNHLHAAAMELGITHMM